MNVEPGELYRDKDDYIWYILQDDLAVNLIRGRHGADYVNDQYGPLFLISQDTPDEAQPWEVELLRGADDPVSRPAHYIRHPSGVECIAITKWMNFCLGNAVKYIWRAGLKGDAVKDLEKAREYLRIEIERVNETLKEVS
ncbi:DUF3310 domain-containing protein [Actinomadura rubrisoli]|uniref:DUF3310 domain-containing protein n=1 Tax=Actinomadura rubrisoli TaxID=2530368 RepID=A0A4R5CG11_9ACTN|nr:DUF3310 domain-containing protein [Actinomadura rubrisoli]TDD97223.1 DUF3310 domain-containing protein [Actinomadura rubrisoli]